MEKFVRNAHKKQKAGHEEAQKNSIQKRNSTISLKNAVAAKKLILEDMQKNISVYDSRDILTSRPVA